MAMNSRYKNLLLKISVAKKNLCFCQIVLVSLLAPLPNSINKLPFVAIEYDLMWGLV